MYDSQLSIKLLLLLLLYTPSSTAKTSESLFCILICCVLCILSPRSDYSILMVVGTEADAEPARV